MASNITVDTLTKGSTTLNTDEIVDTNSSQVCKAWVNFNGTGTVAINNSYNVSSINDNGTGRYSVNLSTAMSNTNYSISDSFIGTKCCFNYNSVLSTMVSDNPMVKTTSSFNLAVNYNYYGNVPNDVEQINIQVFGD